MPARTSSPLQPHCGPPVTPANDAPLSADHRRGKLPFCTASELRQRIGNGEYLVIIDGLVCKLNGFVNKHPGGPLAILHMVGRDATDEVMSMHPQEVLDNRVPRWAVARFVPDSNDSEMVVSYVEDMQLPYSAPRSTSAGGAQYPQPGEGDVKASAKLDYAAIQRDFRDLDSNLHKAGFYRCRYSDYAYEAARYLFLFVTAVGLILFGPHCAWTYLLAGASTAILWQQLAFFAHDLGHNELTGRRKIDMVLGICIADLLGGLSVGWWKKNHNTHHIVTNDVDNDPDIQHLPFFAISTRFFESRYSTYYQRVMEFDPAARLLVSLQDKLYYPIMCFARFNLYFLSWNYLLFSSFAPYRYLEIGCIGLFFVWFSWLVSHIPTWQYLALYMFVSHSISAILHIQITLSHFAMSTESPDPVHECFAARQVRTTMDVICPRWLDWFHGGLQFQVEHHIFPRLPRHKLVAVQPMVKALCRKHGMDFKEFSFIDGNVYTVRWLGEVASRVKLYNGREKQYQQNHHQQALATASCNQ
ncbi:fatty acid desaturase-domain-containing protein [Coemansia spiralis]|nr:fatty acid desaturase-domain-containing protein [Coemansia spiralis]